MDPELYTVSEDCTIRDAITCIDRNASGAALVTDSQNRLLGIITDGDVRRALIKGTHLDEGVTDIMQTRPITATEDFTRKQLLHLARTNFVAQIPIVDQEYHVLEVVLSRDLIGENRGGRQALIMAGGKGSRLYPLTAEMPKPMLKVGNQTILENIVERLRDHGFTRIHISLGYRGDVIRDYFQDGEAFGVSIQYLLEERPLGTAGALGLLQIPRRDPLLVINADILTNLDLSAMYHTHCTYDNDITVAVRKVENKVPYGVMDLQKGRVVAVAEKPLQTYFINAGIYVLSPGVAGRVKAGERCDMTDLIEDVVQAGRRVHSFPIHEQWMDIGNMSDYLRIKNATERERAGDRLQDLIQENEHIEF